MKHARPRTRRTWPALVGTAAIFAAVMVATFGFGAAGNGSTPKSELAASASTDRGSDQTANRGSARTASYDDKVAGLAAVATQIAAANPTTTTTAAPTTTTAAPITTTAAPKPATTTTAAPKATTTTAAASSTGQSQSGGASYYSQPWANKGCAHKTLPKGTVVTVTNVSTGKSTTCVINDRGPYISGRIIDLDTTIFKQLASTSQGVFQARITW